MESVWKGREDRHFSSPSISILTLPNNTLTLTSPFSNISLHFISNICVQNFLPFAILGLWLLLLLWRGRRSTNRMRRGFQICLSSHSFWLLAICITAIKAYPIHIHSLTILYVRWYVPNFVGVSMNLKPFWRGMKEGERVKSGENWNFHTDSKNQSFINSILVTQPIIFFSY